MILVAANGDAVVVVEVKTILLLKNIDHFIEKLKKFKTYFPEYKKRTVYGGMAFMDLGKKEGDKAITDAEEYGLFLIKTPEGESGMTTITNSINFKPREF